MNGTGRIQSLEWNGTDGGTEEASSSTHGGGGLELRVALERSQQESATLRADRELLERSVARLARRVAMLERVLRESERGENVLTVGAAEQGMFRTQ